MSALTPKADIRRHDRDVRFVPIADIAPGPVYVECGNDDSINQEFELARGA
jgi:hypothetical protein